MITIDVMHTFLLGLLRDYSLNYLKIQNSGETLSLKGRTTKRNINTSTFGTSASNSSKLKRKDTETIENPGTSKKYKLKLREPSNNSEFESLYSATERIKEWQESQIQISGPSPKSQVVHKPSSKCYPRNPKGSSLLSSPHPPSISQLRR
ncbi:hypothetical protein O181_085587 [Austropuccinia psidii MF-1]|uniref:Uncharacterized protein n=1 Tax=Austropuccinia psidii MF-1 TaxID=1389203 RepID=A0A9Q3FWC2_9BASI|nr:hypothetical protein [Austropuccinia psidii MF-1]